MANRSEGTRPKMSSETVSLVVALMMLLTACSKTGTPSTTPLEGSSAPTQTVPDVKIEAPRSPVEAAKDLVAVWDDANNRHDIEALRRIYGPEVDFYGQHATVEKVLTAKSQVFRRYPDFRQRIASITCAENDGSIRVSFLKT